MGRGVAQGWGGGWGWLGWLHNSVNLLKSAKLHTFKGEWRGM